MKVLVVAEFYPSRADPTLGIWAHRQARSARDAGAEIQVLVLHRIVPPRSSLAHGPGGVARALSTRLREPRTQTRDGIEIRYVPYVSPSRRRYYPAWGAWAAPALRTALRGLSRRQGPFDLIHAHNAVPISDALSRIGIHLPMVVSVHGGDVLYTAHRFQTGGQAVRRGLGAATLVLANSAGIAQLASEFGAPETRVVHLEPICPSA